MARGRKCTICSHPKRHLMELGLVAGVSLRVLSNRFGVSLDGLHNHRHKHLSPQQIAAYLVATKPADIDLEELSRSESEGLLGNLIGQRSRLHQLHELALEQEDLKAAIAIERAITGVLELEAKLLGQLINHHEVRSTSILVTSDYIKLRQVITETLRKHPDAARDVAAALLQLETEAASEITAKAKAGKPMIIDARALEEVA
jgi:lambda repressor-like predicted transcriptional regulator